MNVFRTYARCKVWYPSDLRNNVLSDNLNFGVWEHELGEGNLETQTSSKLSVLTRLPRRNEFQGDPFSTQRLESD